MVPLTPNELEDASIPDREKSGKPGVAQDELPFKRKIVVIAFVALTQLVQVRRFFLSLSSPSLQRRK